MTEDGCVLCEENYYSFAAADSCIACPDSKFSDTGATSPDDCYLRNGMSMSAFRVLMNK